MGNRLEKCDKCGNSVDFTVSILDREINKKPLWICIECAREELQSSANTAKKTLEPTKGVKGTVAKTAGSKRTKTKKLSKSESSARVRKNDTKA
jgi:superfamily II helicase